MVLLDKQKIDAVVVPMKELISYLKTTFPNEDHNDPVLRALEAQLSETLDTVLRLSIDE